MPEAIEAHLPSFCFVCSHSRLTARRQTKPPCHHSSHQSRTLLSPSFSHCLSSRSTPSIHCSHNQYNTPSLLRPLSINIPLWDLGTALNIPEKLFALDALQSLSFSADCTLHAPDWLLHGPTNFKTGEKVRILGLLDAFYEMPDLKHCTLLFKSMAVWDEDGVFLTAPISMNRLEEFVVRTESPRHFVMPAIPDTARKKLAVRHAGGTTRRCEAQATQSARRRVGA